MSNAAEQLELITARKRMELYVKVYELWAPKVKDYTGNVAASSAEAAVSKFDRIFKVEKGNE